MPHLQPLSPNWSLPFPSGFPTKIVYVLLNSPCVLHVPPIVSSLTMINVLDYFHVKFGPFCFDLRKKAEIK